MADRKVTQSGKDSDGDILRLCNPGSVWGSVTKSTAIDHIERSTHSYYVQEPGTTRANVRVVSRGGQKHLQTTADRYSKNNLDNLPNC